MFCVLFACCLGRSLIIRLTGTHGLLCVKPITCLKMVVILKSASAACLCRNCSLFAALIGLVFKEGNNNKGRFGFLLVVVYFVDPVLSSVESNRVVENRPLLWKAGLLTFIIPTLLLGHLYQGLRQEQLIKQQAVWGRQRVNNNGTGVFLPR
ncbi:hypothetical protein ACFE04_014925 [Oxalis oulophora]